MIRTHTPLLKVLAAFFLIGTLAARPAAAQTTTTVYVYSFEFTTDRTLQTDIDPVINVGDTIRWEWVRGPVAPNAPHNVVSFDDIFDSGDPVRALPSGGPFFEYRFFDVGVYDYYCQPHLTSGMIGRVTVVEPQVIPEPGTPALLASGVLPFLGMLTYQRRRKRI